MKTTEDIIEATIAQIVFDYSDELGVRNYEGEKYFQIILSSYRCIFGDELYQQILSEAKKRLGK